MNRWKSRTLPISIAVAVALLIVVVFAGLGTPRGHSYFFNMSWLTAFESMVWAGVPYPRHLPDLWFGLGGLDFFFYGPLPFWTATFLGRPFCPTCATSTVFSIGGAWLLVLSGIAFYFFARRFIERGPAAVASLAYMVLPYHLLVDWFIRQAAGEFATYIFVPLMALSFTDMVTRKSGGPLFAVSFAGLLLSHLPSALLAVHVFAIVFLAWCWTVRHAWQRIGDAVVRIAMWAGIGAALSSPYWLPAVVLLGDVSADALYLPYFTASNWLYLDGRPEPGPAIAGVVFVSLISASVICLGAIVSGAAAAPLRLWILVPTLTVAFFLTGLSAFVWDNWVISRVQFPWRLMMFSDLALALAIGALAGQAASRRRTRVAAALAGLCVMALPYVSALPQSVTAAAGGYRDRAVDVPMTGAPEYLPAGFYNHVERTRGTGRQDWWDKEHIRIVEQLAAPPLKGGRIIDKGHRRVTVAIDAEVGAIVVPVPYWRHWRAWAGSPANPIDVTPDPASGFMKIEPPPAAERVEVYLPTHWSEHAGLALSACAFMVLCLSLYRRRA